MFNYKYLGREHLEGFDNYKYMSKDTSPLSVYVMHPFWNRVVEDIDLLDNYEKYAKLEPPCGSAMVWGLYIIIVFLLEMQVLSQCVVPSTKQSQFVPRWVAPNALTFAGFILTVLDFALLSFYDYDYLAASTKVHNRTDTEPLNGHAEVIPQSLWYLLAVFLFLAYTLDGIDGKQARRTQTSGPLGELFDHGLDSYSVFFIPACLYSIFGRLDYSIAPIRMYYVMWNLLLNFYLSHWEKYNTGVLFLPWGYDFSMWTSTFIFLWTGARGTAFYKKYVFNTRTLADAFEWLIYGTGVLTNLPVAAYNIYLSYKLKTGKMRSPLEAVRPLWSLLSMFVVCSIWVHKSDRLPDSDPRALFLLIGSLFSNVACRLIVSQMSNQRCEVFNWLLWPLIMCGVASLAVPHYEPLLFYAVTALSVLAHVHYGACVVRQMCEHFRIRCFHIKQRDD